MARKPRAVAAVVVFVGSSPGIAAGTQQDGEWTDVTVGPPPASCWSSWTSDELCNPLDTAVQAAVDFTRISLEAGEYRNRGWSEAAPRAAGLANGWVTSITNKKGLIIQAATPDSKPLLRFDGAGGISIKDSQQITLQGLEIEGPAERITGAEASDERARLTSRSLNGSTTGQCSRTECASCSESECGATADCQYDSANGFCRGTTLGYFNGRGIAVWAGSSGSSSLCFRQLAVHHCPASGIRANRANDVVISDNLVYDNLWWTTSGESAIVFAESQGYGLMSIARNVVYGNRNFMPFYSPSLADLPGQTGSNIGHYASWNQDYIIDGSGVYISRNQDFEGTFSLEENTCFDNGINGVVVHNTDNDLVTVIVERNVVFSNGMTTKDVEQRQSAGGFVINSGINVKLWSNTVATSVDGDYAYQCFNICSIIAGGNNKACVPTEVNAVYNDT
ncbi:unnamed protein product [Prorocentrum cordatum]|uniref:Right handed beta helix domain-containing protein n=1 Tax=Prorocentrum cordatum TaxID=2364126 RepID=A0ABN9QIB3_9DINO|nr:unnamed protein product [Polarella glacialis]